MYRQPTDSRPFTASSQGVRPLPWLMLAVCTLLAIGMETATAQAEKHWSGVAQRIVRQLGQAQQSYRKGDAKAARRALITAYFSEFEDSKMEAAMRMQLGARYTWKVEKRFSALRKAIKAGVSPGELATMVGDLQETLTRDAQQLDQAGIDPKVFEVNQ